MILFQSVTFKKTTVPILVNDKQIEPLALGLYRPHEFDLFLRPRAVESLVSYIAKSIKS